MCTHTESISHEERVDSNPEETSYIIAHWLMTDLAIERSPGAAKSLLTYQPCRNYTYFYIAIKQLRNLITRESGCTKGPGKAKRPCMMQRFNRLQDLTRLPSRTTSSRWQVDKEAIGLSRVPVLHKQGPCYYGVVLHSYLISRKKENSSKQYK